MSLLFCFLISGDSVLGQTEEQKEKLVECREWKWDRLEDPYAPSYNVNAFRVNCPEFAYLDYDTIEKYLRAEHPELLKQPE